ncbi:hypothetical protein Ddye_024731 [Dipteronia dyeriana]|uniref:Uncharacterized protein n=1 Tax=Dipteronia dyeriana TaxID=168575 RepID=A0AAD9TWF3_9ROSI|nr:hypothetical protein Ddye_024731 [Dipteronia dyeriana]
MDESWRMRMGMQTLPRKKSSTVGSTRHSFTSTIDPDDFSDVFGGPPRTMLSRKYSADFTSSTPHFYTEIFRNPSPEIGSPPKRSGGRILPAFTIPSRNEGFYSDIFSSRDGRKSRERSRPKSNSSSVLSSEELSPLRPPDGDDVALSSFASKLRPINVPCRWNSTSMMPDDQRTTKQAMPTYHHHHHHQNQYMENDNNNFRSSYYYGFSRRVSSPETISIEPNSYRSIKLSMDDMEFNNSPSSPASSLCQEPEAKTEIGRERDNFMTRKEEEEMEQEEDEDEVMSSYVIEINSDHREGTGEAVSVDEAIAWAKEKFHQDSKDHLSPDNEERSDAKEFLDQRTRGHGTIHSPKEEQKKWTAEEVEEQSEDNREMESLEQEIRLWSAGKETNIRLLLSTLHHMLWPDSGWYAIPLTSLIESSQVKKAYQKARLCLHPDKLQQRGATLPQKYIAEKIFSILQDAWSAFLSQDVFF